MKEGQVIKIHILINKQLLYYSEEESSFLFFLQNILIEFLYIYRSAKKQLFFSIRIHNEIQFTTYIESNFLSPLSYTYIYLQA